MSTIEVKPPSLASIRRQLREEAAKPLCPNAAKHTPQPSLYLPWHEWASEMTRTHVQRRCPGCQRFTIWVRRESVAPAAARTNARNLRKRFGLA